MPSLGEAATIAPSPPGTSEARTAGQRRLSSAPLRPGPSAGEAGCCFPSSSPSTSSVFAARPTRGSYYSACANSASPPPILPPPSLSTNRKLIDFPQCLASGGHDSELGRVVRGFKLLLGFCCARGLEEVEARSLPCWWVQWRFFGACGEC